MNPNNYNWIATANECWWNGDLCQIDDLDVEVDELKEIEGGLKDLDPAATIFISYRIGYNLGNGRPSYCHEAVEANELTPVRDITDLDNNELHQLYEECKKTYSNGIFCTCSNSLGVEPKRQEEVYEAYLILTRDEGYPDNACEFTLFCQDIESY